VSVRTVLGVLADRDGHAQRREGPELRCRSWAFSSLEYRDRQDRVPVRLNHGGPRIGRLEHLELDRQDRLIAVASVDANIITIGDWFFSGGLKYRGDAPSRFAAADIGHEIAIYELAVTREPASVSLRPLEIYDGDFTRSWIRQGWRAERNRRELLERAALSAGHGGQLTIRRGDPEIVKVDGGYPADDELVAVSSRHDVRPPGALRHSTHRGRIIAVR
jgi:hypothetical protein